MWDEINSAGLLRREFTSILFRLKYIWALARDRGRDLTTLFKNLHLHLVILWSCGFGSLLTTLRDIIKADLRRDHLLALIFRRRLLERFVELAHAPAECSLFILALQQEKVF